MKEHPIEWCQLTLNPVTGCKHKCDFCYAVAFSARMARDPSSPYGRLVAAGHKANAPAFHLDVFKKADRKLAGARSARRVFLGSMADLGGNWKWLLTDETGIVGEALAETIRDNIRDLMQRHPRHTFLVLTKNPAGLAGEWPENAHVGTSVTRTSECRRVDILMQRVRAGVRWVSVEPLLESEFDPSAMEQHGLLGWVVVGAQTGTGAGEPQLDATWRVVEWGRARGVPVFVKHNMRCWDESKDWPQEFPEVVPYRETLSLFG